ncbi:hypothetical protein ACMHYB_50795 [Sorangium sp. So ce1128]
MATGRSARAALSSCVLGGAVELRPGQIGVVRRARRLGGRLVKHTVHETIEEGHGRREWQRVWTTTELSRITEASR